MAFNYHFTGVYVAAVYYFKVFNARVDNADATDFMYGDLIFWLWLAYTVFCRFMVTILITVAQCSRPTHSVTTQGHTFS